MPLVPLIKVQNCLIYRNIVIEIPEVTICVWENWILRKMHDYHFLVKMQNMDFFQMKYTLLNQFKICQYFSLTQVWQFNIVAGSLELAYWLVLGGGGLN